MEHGDKLWSSTHLCYPETCESDGTRRQIMVICTPLLSRDKQVRWHTETNYGHPHPFCYLETIKSDGTRRPLWSSAPFSLSRDNQVWWHVETIMVIHFHCFLRLLKSPLPSRDNQVRWHVETIMVIRFCCFWDYVSFLCHLETIKSNGMQRPSWSFALIVFETILVSFAIQRWSSPMARRDKLWSSASFRRRQCLQSLYAFRRRQCLHVHFKDDNVFIYISKTTMSSIISCLQKETISSFTFRRWQMSSGIACFQKVTMSSYTFRRRQCLLLKKLQCLLSLCFIGYDALSFYAFKGKRKW